MLGERTSQVNSHLGSTFEDFLEAEGFKEEAYAGAAKRLLAWQIAAAMKASSITKSEMARRMDTSRAQLDRLLDPANNKVQLDTMEKAANAVGRKLSIELR